MTRLVKEYLKSLVVMYHEGHCNLWPQNCNGQICNGHIGHITEEGLFEEVSVDEYNFVKQVLGIELNKRCYKIHLRGKRYSRYNRDEVISEGITSPSKLFEFVRKYESRTYVDPEELIEKFGCRVIEEEGCCILCDPLYGDDHEED
ncbi:MAG: hypothetical protein ACI4PU_10515 [Intestinibacter sp.]